MNDQEYANATTAFQMDPELRNLLMQTMAQASQTQLPAGAASPFKMPESAADQFRMTAGLTPPPMLSMANQQSNTQAKSDMLPPNPGAPPPGPGPAPAPMGGPPYNPMQQFGPTAAVPTQQAAQPNAVARPAPIQAGMPGMADSPSKLTAFLQGLGSSDAILPAIGGGMAAVENVDRSNQVRNQTVRALMNRGLDADSALAAAQNPEVLKAVLPGLFGGEKQLGSKFDANGQEQKGFYDKAGNWTDLGGPKRDQSTNQLSIAQGRANIKRVEGMKTNAAAADTTIGDLNNLKTLRDEWTQTGVPGGSGLGGISGVIAKGASLAGYGAGDAINSAATKLQLGLTALTKGSISDREMALFANATPGLNMADPAANMVIAAQLAAAQRVKERAKFFESYMGANKGSLEGAEDTWEGYVNANPIIIKNADGTLAINKNNVGNWKDYVGGDGEDRRTNFGPSPGDTNYAGPAGSAASGNGPAVVPKGPTVTTKEEYDALTPGTIYYDAQGHQATKRARAR